MSLTQTLPLDEKAMWRRLVARAHPDAGGPPRYFHTRCGDAAYAVVMNEPNLYRLTVRHVEEVTN